MEIMCVLLLIMAGAVITASAIFLSLFLFAIGGTVALFCIGVIVVGIIFKLLIIDMPPPF